MVVSVFKMTSNHSAIDGCLRYVQRDDHELIFHDKFPLEFLKYVLLKLYTERTLIEMKNATKKIKKSHKILMEIICEINEKVSGYENDPDTLIHEMIEIIFKDVADQIPLNLNDDLEVLEIGLNSLKCDVEHESLDHLVEIWRLIDEHKDDPRFKRAYWKILSLILKYHKNFDISVVKVENFDKNVPFGLYAEVEVHLMRHKVLRGEEIEIEEINKIFKIFEELIEKSKHESELKILMENLKIFISHLYEIFLEDEQIQRDVEGMLKSVIRLFKDVNQLSIEFWEK